jgi:hypothetical protein
VRAVTTDDAADVLRTTVFAIAGRLGQIGTSR